MKLNGPRIYWKSDLLPKMYIFLKIGYKNVQYFNLAHAYKPKVILLLCYVIFFWYDPFWIFFLALFLSFFLALLFLLPFALNILSDCRKKLSVNYAWSLEIGPWSITCTLIMGLFITFFHQKLIAFFFICSVGKRSISKTDSCVDWSFLALLSAFQEYLVAFKLMTSQAWPIIHAYMRVWD